MVIDDAGGTMKRSPTWDERMLVHAPLMSQNMATPASDTIVLSLHGNFFLSAKNRDRGCIGPRLFPFPKTKVKETLVLTSPRSSATLRSLDILVDIGVPSEKEVIR